MRRPQHDGSAATLAAAISAHRGVSLGSTDLNNLAAYLGEIGCEEATGTATPPGSSTSCAGQNGTCSVPSGTTAVVYYGANGKFNARGGASGGVACNNATFGDPISGTAKACWR